MKKLTPTQKLEGNVAVVTSKAGPVFNGCTVAWITRFSINPPLVGVALSKDRFTYWVINQSKNFVLNLLTDDAKGISLAKHFGTTSGRNVDKFTKIKYFLGATDNPILKDAAAYMECKVIKKCTVGDHILFVGQVVTEKNITDKTVLSRLTLRKKNL
ncbi:flavin reductase family protein [Candidatus Micrarchaeota archaeon]|nr:flavin reductase family protein [Candidatus Micrarchaeota archaeon]